MAEISMRTPRIAGLSRRDLLRYSTVGVAAVAIPTVPTGSARAAEYNLRVFANSSLRQPLESAIDRFVQRNPGSRIRANYANTDQIQTTTRVQLGSGTAPDLLTVWPGNGNPLALGQIAPAGYLVDLSGQPFVEEIPEAFEDVLFWDGKVWFFTNQVSMIGAIANKRVWDAQGLQQPQRWSEFLDACQKLKDAGIVPLALGNGTPWITQLVNYSLVATTVFQRNPNFAEDMQAGKVTFAGSEGWREAMNKYLELNERGFFNPNPNGTSYEEVLQMLASGKAATAILTMTGMPNLYNFAGHKDFVVWPVPATETPSETWIAASPASGLGINAQSGDREGALAFINFLAEPESVSDWVRVTGLPSFLPAAEEHPDPTYAPILPFIREGRSALYMDNKWPNARVQQTHFSGVQQLFAGEATIDEVLQRMDEAYKSG
jgi:raffinose/stachyose/melibiose transport system substrate-binding protein